MEIHGGRDAVDRRERKIVEARERGRNLHIEREGDQTSRHAERARAA